MQIIWSQISVDCSPEPFPLQSVTSNVGGKLWIPREHVVERVFVECVEVTVIHGADTGITGLHEEQGDFPEELAVLEGIQHGFAVRSNDFHRTATDEVHVPAVLPN